jgi:hypothetical protein
MRTQRLTGLAQHRRRPDPPSLPAIGVELFAHTTRLHLRP